MSSFPVPVSPWIKTAESVRATICTELHTRRRPRLEPISSPSNLGWFAGVLAIMLTKVAITRISLNRSALVVRAALYLYTTRRREKRHHEIEGFFATPPGGGPSTTIEVSKNDTPPNVT